MKQGDVAQPRVASVLGSTGSVGRNTLELIAARKELYRIEVLAAGGNFRVLSEQSWRLRPRHAVIANQEHYLDLKQSLAGSGVEVSAGKEALREASARPADWTMVAIVGAAALEAMLAAVRNGAIVAFASKECLVCAGELVMSEAAASRATVLPVDSEHNAIYQVFDFKQPNSVERLLLTASGGPLLRLPRGLLSSVTPEQALAHPVWQMGAKISIDSATMMNKALEIIEAHFLFSMPENKIEVLIHPQSVIHSMVEYADGSLLAQLGTPDMRIPIAHALAWPERIPSAAKRLNLAEIGTLNFELPDLERFPALNLAREALRAGDSCLTALNAANEVAVEAFLQRKIGFDLIEKIVTETVAAAPQQPVTQLADVQQIDAQARDYASSLIVN